MSLKKNKILKTLTNSNLLADPYVDILHDKYPSSGGRVELRVRYEASSAVKIVWSRTGSFDVSGEGLQRNGHTSMVIESANYKHNNRMYTVVITDTTRNRSCSTSASVYVD